MENQEEVLADREVGEHPSPFGDEDDPAGHTLLGGYIAEHRTRLTIVSAESTRPGVTSTQPRPISKSGRSSLNTVMSPACGAVMRRPRHQSRLPAATC